uniref:Putative secreted protein n=1 Tax=Ixodes ricinus TaxID=34613 RepID=A0A6B0UES2_IXORI
MLRESLLFPFLFLWTGVHFCFLTFTKSVIFLLTSARPPTLWASLLLPCLEQPLSIGKLAAVWSSVLACQRKCTFKRACAASLRK